jgi:YHS domain-containing protein
MLDLQLTAEPVQADTVKAGYSCPCGCTPATTYRRGSAAATEGCCCGNEFAVGPDAESHVHAPTGFQVLTDSLMAPWGDRLPVAWAIGPSTHDEPEHAAVGHSHHDPEAGAGTTTDPVCGMTIDPEASRSDGLHSRHHEADYFFCGKGCKLEFDEDPARHLDPSYVPSM